jgi:uncharacterized protein (DUF58 family)
MKLTRRGWVVVGVAVAGTVMAAMFGARSLNAVVFPCLVALVAAVVQVYRIDPPSVDRTPPSADFPDATKAVTVRFDTDSPFTASVRDALPASFDGDSRVEMTVGREPLSYRVTYRRRGQYTLGPVSFVARDVLGLATKRFVVDAMDTVLVYPRVYPLSGRAKRDLLARHDTAESPDRDEFDRLRQYVRGDSLRDVHWKSSAKRDDLIVKEFSADNRSQALTVTLAADQGQADRMADAGATVVVALLRAGVPVTLVTPAGTSELMPGDRVTALELLAEVGHGTPATEDDPGVEIVAGRRETLVRFGDRELPFEQLVDDSASGWASDRPGDAASAPADEGGRTPREVAA